MKTAEQIMRRVAHGLVWIGLSLLAAVAPASVYSAAVGHSSPMSAAAAFGVLLIGAAVLSYLAIRYRWSLTWALVVLLVVSWLSGVSIPIIVGLIGLGKLIIQAVGRGSSLAASEIAAPVLDAHPRGLVESVSHE